MIQLDKLHYFLTMHSIFHEITYKKKKKCNLENYISYEFSFERANMHAYRPQSNEKQSFVNCLAVVEELQSPISANSRCPITGAC